MTEPRINFEFVFDTRQRSSLRWFVRDHIDDYMQYRLPCKIESEVKRRLPSVASQYLRDQDEMKRLMRNAEERVETKTREVMRRVTNEDPYQNAVFGEFMRNTKSRVDADVKKSLDEKNKEINGLRSNQKWLTAGLIGSLAMGAYSIFVPKE